MTPTKASRRLAFLFLLAMSASFGLLLTGDLATAASAVSSVWGTGTLNDDEILALISQMTLAEEIGMVQGAPDNACAGVYVSPSVHGCQGQAGYMPGVARLGIPPLRLSDGPAGARAYHVATALPAPVALAATFDPSVARSYAGIMGREARATNMDVLLAPMINMAILPTGGRNFEVLGEDPYLAGRMAAAEVEGIQAEGMIATLKALAANDFENGRTTTSVTVDDQTLFEMVLPAFEEGVQAGAGAIMCAYNRINDVHACSSDILQNGILRDAFGFTGWVMSDWGAVHRTSDLMAGLDVDMPWGTAWDGWRADILESAVTSGTSEIPATNDLPAIPGYTASEWKAALDAAVFRVLKQMNNAGLLEGTIHGSSYTDGTPFVPPRPDLDALRQPHADEARLLAAAGAVLLKNENILPLRRKDCFGKGASRGVLVMGPTAIAPYIGGRGSSQVHPFVPVIGPYEAILAAAEEGAQISYVPGYDLDGEIVPSSALTAPDTSAPYPHWTLNPQDSAFSGQPGLLRQPIQVAWVPPGAQPQLDTGPSAAPDRLDATLDYSGAAGLPVSTGWRWTGVFTAPNEGDWQLKVFVSHQSRVELFIDGLDPANRTIDVYKYPSFPSSYGVLEQSARSHDLAIKDLQQATWSVHLGAGQQLHLDLRVLTGPTEPTQLQLRWIPPGWQDQKINEAVAAARSAKKVIVFAYDDRAEGGDLGGDNPAAGLSLPGYQDALISAVAEANPSTIVVLNTGGPVLMPWADAVGGILEMWYPGQMGGPATVDILVGDVSPGGKLPVTFPPDTTSYPQHDPACTDRSIGGNCPLYPGAATLGFLGSQPHGYRTVDYTTNGIFVGYRWYDRENVEPLFPFGHGLAYTRFRYSRLSLTPASDGGIDVRFRVENVGRRAGDEIAQVYVGPSAALDPGVRQAAKKLVQFARVSLAPNRATAVEVHVGPRELSSWSIADEDWVRGAGTRTIYVGSSSRDIRLQRAIDVGP